MGNMAIREKIVKTLRWSEKYTGTDMVYLAKGGFWVSFTSATVSLIAFIKMVVFGRFLPQETYGIYSYIIAASGLFAIFSLPGIKTAIIRSVARKKEGTLLLAVKTQLKWGVIGSLLSLVLSLWYFVNQNSTLGTLFLIVAIFIPFFSTFNIFNTFWQAKKRFYTCGKYEIISDIFISFSIIIAVIATNSIVLIVLAYFLAYSIFYGIALKKTIKKVENKEEDGAAISFGKNLTLISALAIVAEHVDKIIIWKFLGPASVAVYVFAQAPAYKLLGLIPLANLALPRLGESNIKEIKHSIFKKFKNLFFLSVPLAIFMALISPYLYRIFFPQYISSVPYFQVLMIIVALLPFTLLNLSFVSEMRRKELYLINSIVPFVKIVLFFVLIPFFGIWGIVFSVITAQIISGAANLYFFSKL